MGTKIQINSLAALERLIGGEADTEIEIRASIVREFSKNYLRDVAESAEMQIAIKDIRRQVEQGMGAWQYSGGYSSYKRFILEPNTEKSLKELIDESVISKFEHLIKKSVDQHGWLDKIDALVKERAEHIMNKWTSDEIEDRISKAADKKIKEKLGVA